MSSNIDNEYKLDIRYEDDELLESNDLTEEEIDEIIAEVSASAGSIGC